MPQLFRMFLTLTLPWIGDVRVLFHTKKEQEMYFIKMIRKCLSTFISDLTLINNMPILSILRRSHRNLELLTFEVKWCIDSIIPHYIVS